MEYVSNQYNNKQKCNNVGYSMLTAFILLFVFSSDVSGKTSRLKQVLEDAKVASPSKRKTALKICAKEQIEKCYYLMIKALKDPGTTNVDDAIEIRNAATVGLVKLRIKMALEPLKEIVQVVSKQIEEQKSIISKLRQEFASLAEILMAENTLQTMHISKSNMIYALGSIRDAKIIDYIIPFLKDESKLVRMKAALSISYLPNKKNQPLLEKHLIDEKEEIVQLDILRALLAIDRFNYKYINGFIKMFFSDNPAVRKKSARIGMQFRIVEGREVVERAIALELRNDVSLEMKKYKNLIFYH